MKADVEIFANKFEEIKARIPVEFAESELRNIVNQYATRNGLKTVRTERRAAPVIGATTAGTLNVESLVEQVILLYDSQGTYLNFSKFVAEISVLEKIIKIGDFSLAVVSAANLKVKNYELTFKTNIIGYKQSLESLKDVNKKVKQ